MKRILVTRPEPGATRTAERLSKLGYEAIKMPLSQTVALQPEFSQEQIDQERIDIVVATSAQAIFWLPLEIVSSLTHVPMHVVGAATGEAARKAGFQDVSVSGNDVESLIFQLRSTLAADIRILYLCGKVRRPDLEQNLLDWGAEVAALEVYDTIPVSYSTKKLNNLFELSIDAILLTSLTNACLMTQLLTSITHGQAFEKTTFICLSQRIANGLKTRDTAQIVICKSPNEDEMFVQLAASCPV